VVGVLWVVVVWGFFCGGVWLGVGVVVLSTKIEREIDAQYLSGDKMRAKLGWSPQTSLDDGLTKTIEWYRKNSQIFQ
jgi:nucleoside-diphosphate-sugar epimerase